MPKIVRVRHPKGILKLELPTPENAVTPLWLYEKIAKELGPIYEDVETFWISLDPQEPEISRLNPSDKPSISFTHGQLIYLHLKNVKANEKKNENSEKFFSSMTIDEKLLKLDGKIIRKRDERLCRHGPAGMCENCQPLEPYDLNYLEQQGIKHSSFYAWLKKLKDSSNAAVPLMSLLETPNYTVDSKCPYHAPFPEAICTKCQPSAIILRQQPFRMVDHVEISSPRLIDEFLAGWRRSGFQRFGWLIGRYDSYIDQVPLGIKSVVEYIYEPSQDGSVDGFQLLDSESNGIDQQHMEIFSQMNLQVVGMIYTDLIDDGTGTGHVEHRRSKESFFVSSPEILFISHQQAIHPFKFPQTSKKFSSRFVSVIISGEADGGIGLKAYQVSESAVAMEEANLIAATTDPSKMLVRTVDDQDEDPYRPLYVPQVFYKFKNEYGIEVQKAADPFFPVEYLLVTLSEGIPLQPTPLFKSPLDFPGPSLHPTSVNLVDYFSDALQMSSNQLAASGLFSNANLLLFLSEAGLIANDIERSVLCQSLNQPEALAAFIDQSETWQKVLTAISESVAMKLNNSSTQGDRTTWTCKHCTFVNESLINIEKNCEMCGLPEQ